MEPEARPAFSLPSDNQIRLILVTLLGLGFAIYLGIRVGEGDIRFVSGLGVVTIAVVVMGAMGDRAWLLVPLGISFNLPVPITFGRDFSMQELVSMSLIVYTVFRVALRRQKIVVFQKENLWPMLYAGWALMVFAANPIGLYSFGAESVGARSYFHIFLALGVFVALASYRVKESEIPWMFGFLFVTNLLFICYSIWSWKIDQPIFAVRSDAFEEVFYTWEQSFEGFSGLFILYIFSRYPMLEIVRLRNLWILGGTIISVGMIIYSGRRMAVGSLILIPLVAAILRKRFDAGIFFALGAAAILMLATFSHGRWVNLPLNVQRSLSWLPGNWDMRVQNLGTKDEFRQVMRGIAFKEIEKHPWMGSGFALNLKEYALDARTFTTDVSVSRSGRSWHSTWIAIAVDFGIPAAIIWGLLWLHFLRLSYRVFCRFPEWNWGKTLAGYIFLNLCLYIARSYTAGHSAETPFDTWWSYALLMPLGRLAEEVKDGGRRTGEEV